MDVGHRLGYVITFALGAADGRVRKGVCGGGRTQADRDVFTAFLAAGVNEALLVSRRVR